MCSHPALSPILKASIKRKLRRSDAQAKVSLQGEIRVAKEVPLCVRRSHRKRLGRMPIERDDLRIGIVLGHGDAVHAMARGDVEDLAGFSFGHVGDFGDLLGDSFLCGKR